MDGIVVCQSVLCYSATDTDLFAVETYANKCMATKKKKTKNKKKVRKDKKDKKGTTDRQREINFKMFLF